MHIIQINYMYDKDDILIVEFNQKMEYRESNQKKIGKSSIKIIKRKGYDEDKSNSEVTDFDNKLVRFQKFKVKYGKNFVLKKPNKYKFLNSTSYISNNSGKKYY